MWRTPPLLFVPRLSRAQRESCSLRKTAHGVREADGSGESGVPIELSCTCAGRLRRLTGRKAGRVQMPLHQPLRSSSPGDTEKSQITQAWGVCSTDLFTHTAWIHSPELVPGSHGGDEERAGPLHSLASVVFSGTKCHPGCSYGISRTTEGQAGWRRCVSQLKRTRDLLR